MIPGFGGVTRMGRAPALSGVAALIAIAGAIGGCGAGSLPSATTPTPLAGATTDDASETRPRPFTEGAGALEFSPVSDDDVAEARSRLAAKGVTASELAAACHYYANHGWAYAGARNAADKAAAANADPAPRRIADVIVEVSIVAQAIAMPTEWVASVAGSIDKPLSDWTDADRDVYASAVTVRKGKLIEPLCTR